VLPACTEPTTDEPEADVADAPAADLAEGLPSALARAGVAPLVAHDATGEPPPPALVPGPVPPRPEGGDYLLVRGPTGAAWVPFHVVGDDVMIGDDILLGSIGDTFGLAPESQGTRALAESTLGARWPDGVVPFDIDADVDNVDSAVIHATLDELEAVLPLTFLYDATAPDRVRFEQWDEGYGLSEGIGMKGGIQKIKLPQSVNARTVAHEMLHALGRFHEQQRFDRDDHVDYHPECVAVGASGNFTKLVGELALGPYDLGSLMHYRGTSQCAKIGDQCICDTLTYAGTDDPVVSPTNGCDQNADPVCFFSDLDIGATWTMYGDFRDDVAEYSDYLGWATVAGDFDGDGLDDVAASATLAETWRGEVMTFKGSYGIKDGGWAAVDPGVVPWRVLRRSQFTAPANADLFGISLAAGDFDGDGFDDLAVGTSGADGHGAVYVYRGSRGGLVPDVELTPMTDGGNLPFAGAEYGGALAAVDVNGDGVVELVVGAPGDRPNLAGNACGGVYVYDLDGTPDLLARWNPSGASCHEGAEAGAALAGSSRSGSVGRLLVVGAPGADSDRGRVWVLGHANTPTLSVYANLTQASAQSCGQGGIAGPDPREVGDRFGAAVAAGKRSNTHHVIAVGSPGEDAANGRVDVFRWDSTCWAREDHLTESPLGADEAGDQFGAALAIGNLTGDSYGDLLVGAPGEAVGAITAGWMYTFRGTSTTFVPHHGFGQSSGGWNDGNGERFGQSFALADVDGNTIDLIVGAPGNHIAGTNYAGSLFLWQAQGLAEPSPWRAFSVNSKSPYAQ
jgi:hypothetical protein